MKQVKFFNSERTLSPSHFIPHLQRGFGSAVGVEEAEVGEIFEEGDVVGALSLRAGEFEI